MASCEFTTRIILQSGNIRMIPAVGGTNHCQFGTIRAISSKTVGSIVVVFGKKGFNLF